MQCVLQRCNIPLKEAQLAFMFESSTISLKKCNTPFKETQLPSVWKEHHLFEGKVLLTKKKIESSASFESYTMIWKYLTLLSKNSSCVLLGQEHHLFEGTVSFTKNIILHPQRIHTWKGKLHIPKEYCACLAYILFLNNGLTRMPWGKMNQISFGLIWII